MLSYNNQSLIIDDVIYCITSIISSYFNWKWFLGLIVEFCSFSTSNEFGQNLEEIWQPWPMAESNHFCEKPWKTHIYLVVFPHPFEKYAHVITRQIGTFPQGSGWKWKIFELPTTQIWNTIVKVWFKWFSLSILSIWWPTYVPC